ncbi:hypothetical protein Poli38472_014430 [Pythium oligandrum]|uniref:CAAX prenyl protease 2/Lysostaphin resistance protein A-like domain-containing protein n=1 Tax=Pythium oligandrum TaxID=41045 RepID=A0A8K1FFN3_PYTOL|nr:hypothetical protein Poli38472_014430 [Pythium oligandrum]|eukprot:TMW57827.1 hypothetical protein Poli38472_014430 [Pythium oligandrum]
MTDRRKMRHGWKWLGAPSSGVLGLFAASTSAASDAADAPQSNEDSEASNEANAAIPAAVQAVLLVIEIVMAFGVGLFCIWCATIARTIAAAVTRAVANEAIAVGVSELVHVLVFHYGVVSFMALLFHQHRRVLIIRLGLTQSPPVTVICMSLVVHSVYLLHLGLKVETLRQDLVQISLSDVLQRLLLAPIEEELFFRGLVFHLALNRLRGNALLAGAVASTSFALVHLVNARKLGPHESFDDLMVQTAWAWVVGLFLSLRFALKGSLLECVVLHVINNVAANVLGAMQLTLVQSAVSVADRVNQPSAVKLQGDRHTNFFVF